MTSMPALLVCEVHERTRQRLTRRFEAAGFHVRACDSAQHALQVLEHQRFDALVSGLMLRDQDAVSFVKELAILGLRLPTVLSSFHAGHPPSGEAEPDLMEPEWVRKAAEQARVIFTIKTACRHSRRYHPRILHVEPDAFSAQLVRAALADDAQLTQCATDRLLDDALATGGYDLVILNPVDVDRDRLRARFHRLAIGSPETPLLLHARYLLHDHTALLPESCDLGIHGLDLLDVVHTLILHGREAPLCAQA